MNSSHISTVHLAQDFVPSFLPRLAGFQKGPIEDKGVCRLAFVTPSCPTTDAFNGAGTEHDKLTQCHSAKLGKFLQNDRKLATIL